MVCVYLCVCCVYLGGGGGRGDEGMCVVCVGGGGRVHV